MEIEISPNLISTLKNKFLLLDTNVFIDASIHGPIFTNFFKKLKEENVTLVTIDFVKAEFLRGAGDEPSYKAKELFLEGIIDVILSTDNETIKKLFEIIKGYKLDGKTIEIPDLLLGANLLRYRDNIFLLTRNTNDFPLRVFDLINIVNCPNARGIFTYGVYKAK